MDLDEAIRKRVAVRHFLPKPVPEELVKKILSAGNMAPSGEHPQNWEFILIKDPATRNRLRDLKLDSRRRTLKLLEPNATREEIEKKVERQKIAFDSASWLIAVSYKNEELPEQVARTGISTSGLHSWLSVGYIWLAATASGLGVSPTMYPYDVYEDAKKTLHIPSGYELSTVLRLGYPEKRPLGRKRTVSDVEKKIHHEFF